MKIVVTGAAGLMGQNLIPRLKRRADSTIVALDKHAANVRTLQRLHPDITVIEADLAQSGSWTGHFRDADIVVLGHAQIGGIVEADYVRNNVTATARLLEAIGGRDCYMVHISSSVVNSAADDWYVETKKEQERLVTASGIARVVLRPTLMFGWFDRKHLGWLARFMRKTPVFPIPGDGRYARQPLYCGDFCNIVASCIGRRSVGEYNISGLEKIDYIDLMRLVRDASRASTRLVRVPYSLFWLMLATYALADRNPPFTTKQLCALVTPDIFEVIDWPGIFGVVPTPLRTALEETFSDPVYSEIALEF